VSRDPGLEQIYAGDAKRLKAAKAYAESLIKDGIAVSASVDGQVYLEGYHSTPWGDMRHHEWVTVETLEEIEAAR